LCVHEEAISRSRWLRPKASSPEGFSIELTDDVEYDLQTLDGDKVKTTQHVNARYVQLVGVTQVETNRYYQRKRGLFHRKNVSSESVGFFLPIKALKRIGLRKEKFFPPFTAMDVFRREQLIQGVRTGNRLEAT
jgi:hypothetical protein